MDEAAFVSSRMYTAGILPVSQQKFTTTILTTTPKASNSYIMDQAKKVNPDGNPFMPQLLLGDPCEKCKAKGECVPAFSSVVFFAPPAAPHFSASPFQPLSQLPLRPQA